MNSAVRHLDLKFFLDPVPYLAKAKGGLALNPAENAGYLAVVQDFYPSSSGDCRAPLVEHPLHSRVVGYMAYLCHILPAQSFIGCVDDTLPVRFLILLVPFPLTRAGFFHFLAAERA